MTIDWAKLGNNPTIFVSKEDAEKLGEPDLQKAQEIMHDALLRVCTECNLRYRWDLLSVASLASVSAILAEAAVNGKTIHENGGPERCAKFFAETFEEMLCRDLNGRLAHERKIARDSLKQ